MASSIDIIRLFTVIRLQGIILYYSSFTLILLATDRVTHKS